MKLDYLTYFIFQINLAIDSGKYQDIAIGEIENYIEEGNLIDYLEQRLKNDVDLSLFTLDEKNLEKTGQLGKELNAEFKNLLMIYKGQEKDWGITNTGLCLLVAWTTELIQQKKWQD